MLAPIRLIIADDHTLFRQGLKSLLRQEPELALVGEAERADEIPALLERVPCDQILLDLQMERNVLGEIETLAERAQVVILTASQSVAEAVAAVRMGARAVVFKRFAIDTLVDAVRTVHRGEVWMPTSIQAQMAAQLRTPPSKALSPRECEVFRHVAIGWRNAEIAKKLAISEPTVKTHLNRIFRKLGVRDRVDLVLYATGAACAGVGRGNV